jgi:hypothetical protein
VTAEYKRCIYTRLDNGIHEFVFTESSREAVDEFTDHVKRVLDTTPMDAPPTCYLVDNSQVEFVPLTYARVKIKEMDAHRPEGRDPSRVAILYEGFMGHIANSVLAVTLKNRFRFFKPADREAAINWLMQYA